EQDRAAELGGARGEGLERVEGEPQRLAVVERLHGRGARQPVEEADLPEHRPRLDRAAPGNRGLEPSGEDDVERTVVVACADDVLARTEADALRVAREARPVLARAAGEEHELVAVSVGVRIVEEGAQTFTLGAAAAEGNRVA